jgi:hypothetical protein
MAPAVWLSLLQFHYGCRRLLRLLSNCLSVEEKQRIDCWYSKSATPFESTHRHSYPSHSSETCKHSFSSSSNPLVSRVFSFRHGERPYGSRRVDLPISVSCRHYQPPSAVVHRLHPSLEHNTLIRLTRAYSPKLSPSYSDDCHWTSRHELCPRSRDWTRRPVSGCTECWCVFLSFLSLSSRPEVLMDQKVLEEAIPHNRLSHKLRPWMRLLPLAVLSRAEYLVLLLRFVAEATSTTPNTMLVISQHRQDKVRVRQRHRIVRISSQL